MMISPEAFLNMYKTKTYSELLATRDELLQEIRDYESSSKNVETVLIMPSPDTVYRMNLLYLAKLLELIEEKYGQEVENYDVYRDGEYLFLIQDYLQARGFKSNSDLTNAIERRNAGEAFPMSEHVRAMVYAMLSNQTKWSRIQEHVEELNTLFYQFDVEQIKKASAEYFYNGIRAIKCGNMSTRAQMDVLHENIAVLEAIADEFGSVDAFVTSEPAYQIVAKLSGSKSKYKLKMLGEALIWEYLRNVGVDGAKPDTHLRRFLGAARMGNSKHDVATIEEVNEQIDQLSDMTGLLKAEIDSLIWQYCADGYGEICTKTPRCHECVVRVFCKMNR